MQIVAIVQEFIDLRDRRINPPGSFDKQGRFYSSESFDCCKKIRGPTKRFPYSEMIHCRTLKHVCHKYNVDEKLARKVLKEIEPPRTPKREGGIYYKSVAIKDGKMYSIFDGQTEYILNQQLKQTARQNHSGGFYVYKNIESCKQAELPSRSALLNNPRVILKLLCEGNYCKYDNKIAFSKITPIEIMEDI